MDASVPPTGCVSLFRWRPCCAASRCGPCCFFDSNGRTAFNRDQVQVSTLTRTRGPLAVNRARAARSHCAISRAGSPRHGILAPHDPEVLRESAMLSLTERSLVLCCALAVSFTALGAHEYRADQLRI